MMTEFWGEVEKWFVSWENVTVRQRPSLGLVHETPATESYLSRHSCKRKLEAY